MLEKIIQFRRTPKEVAELARAEHIWIQTRRYSRLIRSIFEEYNENVEIEIDGIRHGPADIPRLLDEWCTNRNIAKTLNFSLQRNAKPLFGFHDDPCYFLGALSERSFVERLASEKIVRYRVSSGDAQNGLWTLVRGVSLTVLIILFIVPVAVVLLAARRFLHTVKAKLDRKNRVRND
jgi:hypothetical protein